MSCHESEGVKDGVILMNEVSQYGGVCLAGKERELFGDLGTLGVPNYGILGNLFGDM